MPSIEHTTSNEASPNGRRPLRSASWYARPRRPVPADLMSTPCASYPACRSVAASEPSPHGASSTVAPFGIACASNARNAACWITERFKGSRFKGSTVQLESANGGRHRNRSFRAAGAPGGATGAVAGAGRGPGAVGVHHARHLRGNGGRAALPDHGSLAGIRSRSGPHQRLRRPDQPVPRRAVRARRAHPTRKGRPPAAGARHRHAAAVHAVLRVGVHGDGLGGRARSGRAGSIARGSISTSCCVT